MQTELRRQDSFTPTDEVRRSRTISFRFSNGTPNELLNGTLNKTLDYPDKDFLEDSYLIDRSLKGEGLGGAYNSTERYSEYGGKGKHAEPSTFGAIANGNNSQDDHRSSVRSLPLLQIPKLGGSNNATGNSRLNTATSGIRSRPVSLEGSRPNSTHNNASKPGTASVDIALQEGITTAAADDDDLMLYVSKLSARDPKFRKAVLIRKAAYGFTDKELAVELTRPKKERSTGKATGRSV